MITTVYGTWNRIESLSLSVEQSVADYLGDFVDDYDFAAVVGDYRAAINGALPDSVVLSGDEFIGPYDAADRDFDGWPVDEDGRLDLKAIVDGVDLDEIANRHDKTI
ncbi:hypothetical protein [Salinispora pacifica]|uniref:hypothetical protein n=1 Tax=Salinispora pacifica TaxID=351187 RepID=UPI00035E8723|nr:hypothetical protein [Salinispora pacifica]